MFRALPLFMSTALAAGAVLAAAPGAAMDIVGLRLGMSEAEATAALQAYSSDMEVRVIEGFYGYSDGVNQLQTPGFVSRIEGYLPRRVGSSPNFVVLLAPPPLGGKAWAIERREGAGDNPPTLEQYKGALHEKYGQPAGHSRNGAAMVWKSRGDAPNCLQNPADVGFPQFRPISDREVDTRIQYAQQARRAPADLGQCAATLHYVLGSSDGSVLGQVEAVLLDIGTYAKASAAATDEVTALEEAARKARAAGAQGPRL